MPLEAKKHLADALHAAQRIARFTSKRSLDEYKTDELLKAAVERQFEIVGEALNRLLKIAPEVVLQISQYRRIIAFRNILIHGYDAIDDLIVWDVVQRDLPLLQTELEALLTEEP